MTRSVSCQHGPTAWSTVELSTTPKGAGHAVYHHAIEIAVSPAEVWDAARDVGALHVRLVPGFVTSTEMLAGSATPIRRVTLASGAVLDEAIISIDDERRRLVWAIRGMEHHNGALQVLAIAGGSRVTWTADILPDALAERFSPLMAQGLMVMKQHLERSHPQPL